MKFLENAKLYNTDTGLLLKENISVEDLGDGYTRYTTRCLYWRSKSKDYWMHKQTVCVDRRASIVDKQDYCYTIEEDYVREFNKSTEV